MSASEKRVRDVGCEEMHKLAICLDKAGFNADIIQDIIVSKGNKKAEAMFASINGGKVAPIEPAEKFGLLVDLGVITVPDDFVHGMCLDVFFKKNRKKLRDYNRSITDANFPNPSRMLKPGDRLRVRAFCQIVSGKTTSHERMDFLKKQKGNVYTGAQGVALVFEQKRDQLPKGKGYASFDEANNLWEDSGGDRGVPGVDAYSGGGFGVGLGFLGGVWHDGGAFLSFSDFVESP